MRKLNLDKNLQSLLNGKTILITGATFGIGEHTARRVAFKGVHLILTARSEEKLLSLKDELNNAGAIVDIFVADMYDLSQTEALIAFLEHFKIDIFINNAGKSICRPIVESVERFGDFSRTMSLNYYSPVRLCLYLLSKSTALHVVNISTLNVLLPPTPYWSAYGASKTAFDYWLRSVAGELKGDLFKASSIYFPLVKTRMIEPTKAYANAKALSPQRASDIICKMIITENSSWKPWWSGIATCVARVFRHTFENLSMRIIDKHNG